MPRLLPSVRPLRNLLPLRSPLPLAIPFRASTVQGRDHKIAPETCRVLSALREVSRASACPVPHHCGTVPPVS
ncbi:unnamed protein product [Spirodela intermedia]|uniref:Uncharacterized protein n=1 Tax=Spirodela intermedia TaxID=51605 RepID=A0A7I8IVY6_SPIIN|nr:unnamed protein product [Spirodela intermedia]CAA6662028.1 unnamed protein product [Spirodela intermedia]